MSKTNSRTISKAIEKKTGIKGVKVCSKGGCCKFYSDNINIDLIIMNFDAVYACYINQLTVETWLKYFEENVADNECSYSMEQLLEISKKSNLNNLRIEK